MDIVSKARREFLQFYERWEVLRRRSEYHAAWDEAARWCAANPHASPEDILSLLKERGAPFGLRRLLHYREILSPEWAYLSFTGRKSPVSLDSWSIALELGPFQREVTVTIDLTASRKSIEAALAALLDNYGRWPKKGRKRPRADEEKIKQRYRAWDLWKQRKTFPRIGRLLYPGKDPKQASDLARKDFLYAHLKVMRQPYRAGEATDTRTLRLADLSKTCPTCDDRTCLATGRPCAAVTLYVNQDHAKQREKGGNR